MLSGLALAGFLLFLALISGGFFLWVYLIVGGIAALAYLNYLLWGRSMTAATAGEREEEERRARRESDGVPEPDPRNPRHS
jgi:hypothetical protein